VVMVIVTVFTKIIQIVAPIAFLFVAMAFVLGKAVPLVRQIVVVVVVMVYVVLERLVATVLLIVVPALVVVTMYVI